MWFIPYERLTLKTSQSTEEAVRKLSEVVEPKRFFRWGWTNRKPYEGIIGGTHFSINRVIHGSNSFLPMISGEIQPEMGGCSIKVSMTPHILVIIFMAIWLGGAGFPFLWALGSFISGNLPWYELPAAGSIFLFGYGLLLGGFKFESVKSKAFLRDLFQANQVFEFGETDVP